jgi:hypothetical protein
MDQKQFIGIIAIAAVCLLVIAPGAATTYTTTGGEECSPPLSDVNVSIALSDIPGGLSGLNISMGLSDPAIGQITHVSVPQWASMAVISPLPSSQVWLKSVDLQKKVKAGDQNVPVCMVTVRTAKSGTALLSIISGRVEDDAGGRYTIPPQNITLCVSGSGKLAPATVTESSYSLEPQSLQYSPVTPIASTRPESTPPSGKKPSLNSKESVGLPTPASTIASQNPAAGIRMTPEAPGTQVPGPTPASMNLLTPLIASTGIAALMILYKKTRKDD